MKRNTFLGSCLLVAGFLFSFGTAQAQSALNVGDNANLAVGNDALLSVHGKTTNNELVNVHETGMVNLHGNLSLNDNTSVFRLNSTGAGKTGSLIGYNTTTDGAGTIESQRYISTDAKWHYFTAPVIGQAINDTWVDNNQLAYWNDENTSHVDFWRWKETESTWNLYKDNNNGGFGVSTFVPGEGFITAVKSDGYKASVGTLVFKGDNFNGPENNAGTVDVSVTYTKDMYQPTSQCWQGWNLIGNPYPSAYQITGTGGWLETEGTAHLAPGYQALYLFVEGTVTVQNPSAATAFCKVSDYRVISNNGYNYTYYDEDGNLVESGTLGKLNQNYLAPGQAFFVRMPESMGATGTLSFPAKYRAHKFGSDATFRKGAKDEEESWPGFMLIANNGNEVSGAVISFDDSMTPALDPSCDVAKLEVKGDHIAGQNIGVYSQLVDGSFTEKLAQQALPWQPEANYSPSGLAAYEIPVGVDVTHASNVTFSIQQKHLDNEAVVLEDRKMAVFTDLNEETYATTLDMTENGFGRFFIHVGERAETIETTVYDKLQISAFMVDKHHLKVLNPALVDGDYQIFNMNGSAVANGRLVANAEQMIDINLATGMYILKVYTNYKTQSFKFINK